MKSYAIITGATSGIGLQLAKIHASRKGNLVIVAKETSKLIKVKKELMSDYNIDVIAYSVDLSIPEKVNDLIKKIKARNLKIKYLINNAGIGYYSDFKDSDINKQTSLLNLNIQTPTVLTHAFIPELMKNKQSYILFVGSLSGFLPGPLMSTYYSSKGYLLSFAQSIRNELNKSPVSVSILCPGPTKTNFTKRARGDNAIPPKECMSAKKVAEIGYESMLNKKAITIPGFRNKLIAFIPRILPRSLVVRLVRKTTENVKFEAKEKSNDKKGGVLQNT